MGNAGGAHVCQRHLNSSRRRRHRGSSRSQQGKEEADSKHQEAVEAKLRATQKAEVASNEAAIHQKDAKAKAEAAEQQAKELSTIARTAQLGDQYDEEKRAFRETAMSTRLAAEAIAAEGLAADPAQAMQQAAAAPTGGHTRIGGVAAVTAAFNAAASAFPVVNPGAWFSPICGGGGVPYSKTRPRSQPPVGQHTTTATGRRRRRKEADKGK